MRQKLALTMKSPPESCLSYRTERALPPPPPNEFINPTCFDLISYGLKDTFFIQKNKKNKNLKYHTVRSDHSPLRQEKHEMAKKSRILRYFFRLPYTHS